MRLASVAVSSGARPSPTAGSCPSVTMWPEAYSVPGRRRWRWRSSRGRGAPRSCVRPMGREAHGVQDLLVSGAAAQVAGERLPHLRVARIRVPLQQVMGRHDEAGVQKPHCTPPASTKACCTGCSPFSPANPSTVTISRSSACPANTRQEQTSVPSMYTEHDPHSPCSQAFLVPGSPRRSRST